MVLIPTGSNFAFQCLSHFILTAVTILKYTCYLFLPYSTINTAGSQIMLFCSMSFHYHTDEKKIDSLPGPLSVWNLHVLLMSAWVSSGFSGSFPHPKDVHVR